VGHRAGFRLCEPGRDRDLGNGSERCAVRHVDGALLLDRRRARDGVPRPRDDAFLLWLRGAKRSRVPAPPLQPAHPPVQRSDGDLADQRHSRVRAVAQVL
jgi:hypothetical protein